MLARSFAYIFELTIACWMHINSCCTSHCYKYASARAGHCSLIRAREKNGNARSHLVNAFVATQD